MGSQPGIRHQEANTLVLVSDLRPVSKPLRPEDHSVPRGGWPCSLGTNVPPGPGPLLLEHGVPWAPVPASSTGCKQKDQGVENQEAKGQSHFITNEEFLSEKSANNVFLFCPLFLKQNHLVAGHLPSQSECNHYGRPRALSDRSITQSMITGGCMEHRAEGKC